MTEGRSLGRTERIHRTRARAWVLQIQYRWDVSGRQGTFTNALADTLRTRRIAPQRVPYVRTLLGALDEHLPRIDEELRGALENWRLERLSTVDRAVLRQACAEMLFVEDVPPKVSIQEAIRLAEQYGGPESPRFVNGVLDALFKGLAEAGV